MALRQGWPGVTGMLSAPQIIYDALVRAAKHGQTCPTNATLAELIGASSTGTPVRFLQGLQKQGAIKLHSGNTRRVVEIPALMLRTAGPLPEPHWRERNGGALHAPRKNPPRFARVETAIVAAPIPPEPVRADNRICRCCGARVGNCEHGAARAA